ncbi:MOSC domain-containing protein [Paenibacillus sp. LjRoot153]|uniref:MOSC domain-containing protein n=1 Tax=Paenibacillus sp. LjRoot153 TaxID=3342270 RepID=UPI003ED0038A
MDLIKVKAVMIADDEGSFLTRQVQSCTVDLGGIPGDRHYGLLRPADGRQKIYPRGTPIANRRQISIVSQEECAIIAKIMGLPEIRPEWLGANLALNGYSGLTCLPLGSRLIFSEGTGLICEGENLPCIGPGKIIADFYGEPELAKTFVKAAFKLRGIVCSVEREGPIVLDDICTIILVR